MSRSGGGALYLQRLYRAGPLYSSILALHHFNGMYMLDLRQQNGSHQAMPLTTQLVLGTWYDVELVYDWSDPQPVASDPQPVANGVLDTTLTDTTTGTLYSPDSAYVGLFEDGWSEQAEADWDNVSIANAR